MPDNARFNRITLGVYEMGSIFKAFTVALGRDSGKVTLDEVESSLTDVAGVCVQAALELARKETRGKNVPPPASSAARTNFLLPAPCFLCPFSGSNHVSTEVVA